MEATRLSGSPIGKKRETMGAWAVVRVARASRKGVIVNMSAIRMISYSDVFFKGQVFSWVCSITR